MTLYFIEIKVIESDGHTRNEILSIQSDISTLVPAKAINVAQKAIKLVNRERQKEKW